ncbi:MAG: hypothetical protein H8E28_09495 [Anaerolineae bacterium]|nr:hypothetical protein [Anaerolineae bacterium]
MRCQTIIYIILCVVCLSGIFVTPVQAQDGLPGSPAFGYGVCLQIGGHQIETAVQIASNYGVDWLTIDFNWAKYWPDANSDPQWGELDRAMNAIGNTSIAAMVSIYNAPAWAMEAAGPSSAWTSELVLRLARRYPQHLLAFEIFPGANTVQGWGTTPNASAYVQLLHSVDNALRSAGQRQTTLATGLNPVEGAQPALGFLQSLYDAGLGTQIPIISLRIPSVVYPPSTSPDEVADYTLRFYEQVRQVMLANGHQNGLIWITRFEWGDGQSAETQSQAEWLQNAYIAMRKQLYIGTASFYCLNDASTATNLLNTDGSPTLTLNSLAELIASENGYHTSSSSDG